jgi:hypothetical protein
MNEDIATTYFAEQDTISSVVEKARIVQRRTSGAQKYETAVCQELCKSAKSGATSDEVDIVNLLNFKLRMTA